MRGFVGIVVLAAVVTLVVIVIVSSFGWGDSLDGPDDAVREQYDSTLSATT